MEAHSTHDKEYFHSWTTFLDGCGQLTSFTSIPCFWTELSVWSCNEGQIYGVLETGSVFELFYELYEENEGSMVFMRALSGLQFGG